VLVRPTFSDATQTRQAPKAVRGNSFAAAARCG